MKVRKKDTFDATQWFKLGDHPDVDRGYNTIPCIRTREGEKMVMPRDWIVTGEDGKHSVVSPTVFEMLYEVAT